MGAKIDLRAKLRVNISIRLSFESISQPSSKMPTLSFGGGSHPGVPCRWKEKQVRINILQGLEYLEGGNWVIRQVVIRSARSRSCCKE